MNKTIKTLDGTTWDEKEILSKMMSDDFYYGFLGKNALSSSAIGKLLDSPQAYESYINFKDDSPALEFGKLFHIMCLEPDKVDNLVIADVSTRASKAYKELKAEHGEVFLKKDLDKAGRLSDSLFGNDEVSNLLEKTTKEVPAIGIIDSIPFRAKADALGEGYIVDLKTTSKSLKSWHYSAKDFNYDSQCFIYCELFDIHPSNFIFVVINKDTGAVGIADGVSTEFYERGKNKVYKACELYREYFIERDKPIQQFYEQIIL